MICCLYDRNHFGPLTRAEFNRKKVFTKRSGFTLQRNFVNHLGYIHNRRLERELKLLLLLPIPFLIIPVSCVYGYTAAYTLGFNAGMNNGTISTCIKAMDYDRCYIGYITGHVQLEQSTAAYKAGFAMQRNCQMKIVYQEDFVLYVLQGLKEWT